MPWLSSAPPKPISGTGPVPDLNALRGAALQASWQRDRSVGRRRLALRWCLFYAGRYGLWVVLLLAGACWTWFNGLPAFLQRKPAPGVQQVVVPSWETSNAAPAAPSQPAEDDTPLNLTAGDRWGVRSTPTAPLKNDDSPTLPLKPDALLYSLEP